MDKDGNDATVKQFHRPCTSVSPEAATAIALRDIANTLSALVEELRAQRKAEMGRCMECKHFVPVLSSMMCHHPLICSMPLEHLSDWTTFGCVYWERKA